MDWKLLMYLGGSVAIIVLGLMAFLYFNGMILK